MTDASSASHAALAGQLQQALGAAYALAEPLGQGGFGVVFAARDLRLSRDVAVKVLRPELAAPMLRERFRREAESAAGLRHPGIIAIYDVGTAADLSWFVMPRIRGETLHTRLARDGRLPVAEVHRLLTEMLAALQVAHTAGIIHRDIKPDNILLEAPGARVVLTDFGIAKSLTLQAGDRLTSTGLVIGTPNYMSPEQAGGTASLDARSDLYSLGVVAYEMLTGAPPFGGPSPAAVLLQQMRAAPEPLRSRRPDTPRLLAAAIDRCLHLEPADRWSSAEDLIATLTGAAPPPPVVQRPGLDPRPRARRIVAAMGLLLLPAVAVDVARGTAMFSPLLLLLTLGVAAAQYGALSMRGYGWQELIPRWAGRQTAPAADRLPEAMLAEAQGDRAVILGQLAGLSRSERELLGDMLPAVDRLVAEIERAGGREGTAGVALDQLRRLRIALDRVQGEGLAAVAPEIAALVAQSGRERGGRA